MSAKMRVRIYELMVPLPPPRKVRVPREDRQVPVLAGPDPCRKAPFRASDYDEWIAKRE